MTATPAERRWRQAATWLLAGLLVQAITLAWVHPIAFMTFLGVGCPLVAAGLYLGFRAWRTPASP